MSKMSELSRALDKLTACGEGLIRTANAIREMFTAEPDEQPKSIPGADKLSAVKEEDYPRLMEDLEAIV